MKVNVSYQSLEHKFLFVRQFYKENLKSVIFNDESKTPAKASNTGQSIVAFLKWAIEIADGLMYIHGKRLIHRHLKLENILVGIKDGLWCSRFTSLLQSSANLTIITFYSL
jgi:serine/threonine protein kinase